MPRTRPPYPPEFRREAIRLVRASDEERPIPKVAKELGVTAETLRNWVKQERSTRVNEKVSPQTSGRVDNLKAHKAYDVLLFSLAHPRWEFAFQPKHAAYINLIEPWWKTLKSLAIKGRFFETWAQIEEAIARAVEYWNGHRHPYGLGSAQAAPVGPETWHRGHADDTGGGRMKTHRT